MRLSKGGAWNAAAGVVTLIGIIAPVPGIAQVAQNSDLFNLSLEQLTRVEVNSVSRHDQPLFDTPAAVFVITRDDILRSGATSIPEVLRMVPGVDVAQIDANKWAVSARGFNNRFANKMLVMIDNRSVYNQLYSGVFWDQADLLLEDVERIEVVRGPGATLWGANAVNGVINIVTRKARDTQGAMVVAETGRVDQEGAARVRGPLGAVRRLSDLYQISASQPSPCSGWLIQPGRGQFGASRDPARLETVRPQPVHLPGRPLSRPRTAASGFQLRFDRL
jgi:outer membrane receptor protein involved in Fe transport